MILSAQDKSLGYMILSAQIFPTGLTGH